MSKYKTFVKSYWPVIICALLAGIILSAGQYLSIRDLGNDYRGIPYLYQDSEDVYLSRIREILEGHTSVASPYFFEYKNGSSPLIPYGEWFYALPIKIFNLDIVSFIHFTKFLFPAILFVLVFLFIHLLLSKKSKITALAGAGVIVIVPNLLSLSYLKGILGMPDSPVISIWTRLVNPVTGALLLFSFFIILIEVRKRSLPVLILAGLLLGFMPGYFFSFAFAGLMAFLLVIFLLFEKEYKVVLRLSIIFPIAFIVSFNYFVTQLKGILYDGNTFDTSLRNGLLLTHQPLSNYAVFLAIVVLLSTVAFVFIKRRDLYLQERTNIQFIFVGLLAGVMVFNQQIITGKAVWPFHFVQYTKPFVFIVLLYSTYLVFSKFGRSWRIAMVSLLVFIFGVGIKDAMSYRLNLENYREYQRYAIVVDWLNQQDKEACVIIAKESKALRQSSGSIIQKLHYLIPAVTGCDVYYSLYTFFNVPQERIFHHYLAYLRLNGVTEKTIGQFLKDNRRQVISLFWSDWNEMFYYGPSDTWLVSISDVPKIENKVDAIIAKIEKDYPAFMKQDFGVYLKKYRVDYLIYDKKYGGEWNRGWDKFLSKETELGEFVIYSFK